MCVSPSGVVRVSSATPSVKPTATSGGQHPLYTHISVSIVDDSSRPAVPKEGESTGRHTDAANETSAPIFIAAKSGSGFTTIKSLRRPAAIGKIATWNVEGFSLDVPTKIKELKTIMRAQGIDVLCMQETHIRNSPYFYSNGFLVIISGGGGDDTEYREYAGVGFLVSPRILHAVIGFTQHSPRIAALRIRVEGGTLVLISAYAPHGGYPYADRQQFYHEPSDVYLRKKSNGVTIILEDLNARFHTMADGEKTCLVSMCSEIRLQSPVRWQIGN